MEVTPYQIAHRFIGIKEAKGLSHNPLIVAMHQVGSDAKWVNDDETPWCSSFVGFICFVLGIPRTKSARARSWLQMGDRLNLDNAKVGWDIVILKRGKDQPGPDVMNAPGHVGFYAGHDQSKITILGGNQGDSVSLKNFPLHDTLAIRRLSDRIVPCEYGNDV